MTEVLSGKMPTTLVRRLSSRLRRSIGLFDQVLDQCAAGNLVWASRSVSDGYGVCTFEELARAMSGLLEFEHPLVSGVSQRRAETMRRFGLSDDD